MVGTTNRRIYIYIYSTQGMETLGKGKGHNRLMNIP